MLLWRNMLATHHLRDDQMLQKIYHSDIYRLGLPKAFNETNAKDLTGTERAKYVEPWNYYGISKSKCEVICYSIGYSRDPGQLFLNKRTGQIHGFKDRTSIWRTTVGKTQTGLERLVLNDFHIFPNAGKPK